jgi:hypothetical protein
VADPASSIEQTPEGNGVAAKWVGPDARWPMIARGKSSSLLYHPSLNKTQSMILPR